MSDFDDLETVRGLPGELPEGEEILWQGAPDWRVIMRRVFRSRLVVGWFGFLAVILFLTKYGAAPMPEAVAFGAAVLPALVLALLVLALLSWATAATTAYTITNRRVTMRFGIALSMTINVPFALIGRAALRKNADGSGDIPLNVLGDDTFSYIMLWPHVRPRSFKRAEPMLRGLKDVSAVAGILAEAMAEYHDQPVEYVAESAVEKKTEDRRRAPRGAAMPA